MSHTDSQFRRQQLNDGFPLLDVRPLLWNLKTRALCLCIAVVLPLWFIGRAAGDSSSRMTGDSLLFRLVTQPAHQSEADIFDCPLLPGCPGGPSIPLPPKLKPVSRPSSPSTPSVDENNLVEGVGKYRGMVLIPAGTFDMGSAEGEGRPDERPVHKVFIKDFYIAKYEVTSQQFCAFLNARGENSRDGIPRVKLDSRDCPVVKIGKVFKPKEGCADKPMVCVSWYGAAKYAEWAGGRLPTSAEWEKAALLSTPDSTDDSMAILSQEGTVPVTLAVHGAKGVTGMTGNVWEWCLDWYGHDYYHESPSSNPMGPALGEEKNIRGGSWASAQASKRIRNRHKASPRGYYRTVGFRIIKE